MDQLLGRYVIRHDQGGEQEAKEVARDVTLEGDRGKFEQAWSRLSVEGEAGELLLIKPGGHAISDEILSRRPIGFQKEAGEDAG